MKVIAVVGSSGSGKTRLVERLVAEFRRRNSRPAVVKHCPHGFGPEAEAKDSQRFLRAGAVAAALVGPGRRTVLKRRSGARDLWKAASEFFPDADVVLVEGGSRSPGLMKIEVRREGRPSRPVCPAGSVAAYVSDRALRTNRPIFGPGEVSRLAGFIDQTAPVVGPDLRLQIDGRDVRLDRFGRRLLRDIALTLARGGREDGSRRGTVQLTLRRRGHATQRH
jgi:molybdopterin-guanine dinucleotide biosynthesis protein B